MTARNAKRVLAIVILSVRPSVHRRSRRGAGAENTGLENDGLENDATVMKIIYC